MSIESFSDKPLNIVLKLVNLYNFYRIQVTIYSSMTSSRMTEWFINYSLLYGFTSKNKCLLYLSRFIELEQDNTKMVWY